MDSKERHQLLRVALGAGALAAPLGGLFLLAFATHPNQHARAFVLLALAALGSYVTYWSISWRVHTSENVAERTLASEVDVQIAAAACVQLLARLHPIQVRAFYEGVVEPVSRFERITESVEPMVRSLRVTTAYTFQSPYEAAGRVLAVPLFLQPRGGLIDDLRVTNSEGQRVSTLGRDATLALASAIIRLLIRLTGQEAEKAYVEGWQESVLRYLGTSQPESLDEMNRILDGLMSLPSTQNRGNLVFASRILRRLRRFYPVIVLATCPADDENAALLGARHRFTVERRTTPAFFSEREAGINAWLTRTRDRVRRLLGIRPAIIAVPLKNANRAASYHLQIRGPEGSYLAWHRVRGFDGDLVSPRDHPYGLRSRLGQRVSHLYIRRGNSFGTRYFQCNFFERMPGSLGSATMSALGAAVLIGMAAATRLDYGRLTGSNPDLVAVLLAFPAVAGTWIGIEQSRNLYGGVLMARVSLLATISLALGASALYTLGRQADSGPFYSRTGHEAWLVLFGLAVINLLACMGGWVLRANVESHFVKRSDPDLMGIAIDQIEEDADN